MPSRSSVEIVDETGQQWLILPEDHEFYDVLSSLGGIGYLLSETLISGINMENPDFITAYSVNLDIYIDTANEFVENGMDNSQVGEEEIVHATKAFIYATELKKLVEKSKASVLRRSNNGDNGANKSKIRRTKGSNKD